MLGGAGAELARLRRIRAASWLARLAVATAFAGLATAGIATATIVKQSTGQGIDRANCDTCGTDTTPTHDTHQSDTTPTEEPPPSSAATTSTTAPTPTVTTPPPPTSCLTGLRTSPASPQACAEPAPPSSAVTPAMKAEALENVHEFVPLLGFICVRWEGFRQLSEGTSRTSLYAVVCLGIMAMIANEYKISQDPPDSNFTQVAVTSPTLAKALKYRCEQKVSSTGCKALAGNWLRFRNAAATTAAASTGTGISVERFGGAQQAGSAAGAVLQAAAVKAYAGELASALAAQQAAGRALAAALRANHVDVAVSGPSLAKKLGAANGIPKAIVSQLIARGVTPSAAELRQTIRTALKQLPKSVTLAGAVGAAAPTEALTQLYRTLTLSDLTVLVEALTNQGALTVAAGQLLSNDLGDARAATSLSARTAASALFVKDTAQFPGPAATLLGFAGRAVGG